MAPPGSKQMWGAAWQGKLLPEAPLLIKGAGDAHPKNGDDHTDGGAMGAQTAPR